MSNSILRATGRRAILACSAALLTFSAAGATIGPDSPRTNLNSPAGLQRLLVHAKKALRQSHPNVAIIYLKKAVSLAPHNAEAQTELGYVALKIGDAVAAERAFRAAADDGSRSLRVQSGLLAAMLERHEAAAVLQQFPDPSPKTKSAAAAETLRARGLAQAMLGHDAAAAKELDRALSISRDTANLIARARLAYDTRDLKQALSLTEEALEKQPHNLPALLMKVSLLQDQGNTDEAETTAGILLNADPHSSLAYLTRAGVELQAKKNANAAHDIGAALALSPNNTLALYYKSRLLWRTKGAKSGWAVAQVLPPDFADLRPDLAMSLADMAFAAGHREASAAMLSSAVQKFPHDVDLRMHLAGQYLALHDPQRAQETLSPLASSQDPRVQTLRGEAFAAEKHWGAATWQLSRAMAAGPVLASLRSTEAESRLISQSMPGEPEVAGPLIASLLRQRELSTARKVAHALEVFSPKSPYGPYFGGEIALAANKPDQAIRLFTTALSRDGSFAPAKYGKAQALGVAGDVASAQAALRPLLTTNSKNSMALILGARLAQMSGDAGAAQRLMRQAVTAAPQRPDPVLALASLDVQLHHPKHAEAVLDAFLAKHPDELSIMTFDAQIAQATGQLPKAVSLFRVLAQERPTSAAVHLLLAGALAQSGARDAARQNYAKAVVLAPNSPAVRKAQIHFLLMSHEDKRALASARDFYKSNSGAEADIILAGTLAAANQRATAEKVLRTGLNDHPSGAIAIALSELLQRYNHSNQATAVLKAFLAEHGGAVGAEAVNLQLAQMHLATKPDEAKREFRSVLEREPNNVVALNDLAWLLRESSPQAALPLAARAARLAPSSASVLDTLGWTQWKLGQKADALATLKRAHALNATNPEAGYHLAVILKSDGQLEAAKRTLHGLISSKIKFEDRGKARALEANLQ